MRNHTNHFAAAGSCRRQVVDLEADQRAVGERELAGVVDPRGAGGQAGTDAVSGHRAGGSVPVGDLYLHRAAARATAGRSSSGVRAASTAYGYASGWAAAPTSCTRSTSGATRQEPRRCGQPTTATRPCRPSSWRAGHTPTPIPNGCANSSPLPHDQDPRLPPPSRPKWSCVPTDTPPTADLRPSPFRSYASSSPRRSTAQGRSSLATARLNGLASARSSAQAAGPSVR